ncbi:hypothetical protein MFLAVUS_009280 [Mucor flavus]|uniref:Chromo domain-containing protein n=1 Tax=Mucor flavus TaxID=439312 RepID=A0ABP9Z9G3_9FUNG
MKLLQHQFLGLHLSNVINDNNNMDLEIVVNDENNYEIDIILDHKGLVVEDSFYLVKWRNYDNINKNHDLKNAKKFIFDKA